MYGITPLIVRLHLSTGWGNENKFTLLFADKFGESSVRQGRII